MPFIDVQQQQARQRALEESDPGFLGNLLKHAGGGEGFVKGFESGQQRVAQKEQQDQAKRLGLIQTLGGLARSGYELESPEGVAGFLEQGTTPGGGIGDLFKIRPTEIKKAEAEAKKDAVVIKKQEGASRDLQKQTDSLRKEVSQIPGTKETETVLTSLEKIESAANDPSPAGDLSLIFGYMRILDPNSTVREGEFATAQNTAGIPDQVRNAYNKALSGERLNKDQRNDFIKQAKNLSKAQVERYKQTLAPFEASAKARGLPGEQIFRSLPQFEEGALDTKDQQALDWLLANPSDPNAPAVKAKLMKKGLIK